MALPATDSFTNSNGTALTAHSASWSENEAGFEIQSDSVCCTTYNDALARWNADAFDDDQYSQADVVALGASFDMIGIAVRANTGGANTCYGIYEDGDNGAILFKIIVGDQTQLGSTGDIWAVTNVVRLEASSTTITPMKNGGTDTSIGAQTDGAISSGSAGLTGYADSDNSRIDDWEGGNLSTDLSVSEAETVTVSDTIGLAMVALAVGKAESITVQGVPTVNVESLVAPLSIAIVPTDSTYDIAKPVIVG